MNMCQVTFEEAQTANMTWRGKHAGVDWEIAYWGVGSMNDGYGMWNRYIIVPEVMIPDDFAALWLPPEDYSITDRKWVGYRYEETVLADLEWNGGATFYKKLGGLDGQDRGLKIGCDYGHSWDRDQGYPYDLARVMRDAERTCEAFRERFPASLWRCGWDGSYHPSDEMEVHPKNPDTFYWRGNLDKVPDAWKEKAVDHTN